MGITNKETTMKKITYIQEYSIRGGQDERSGEETKCSSIMVKDENPEQDLWDMVLNEMSSGYEQRLFVNDAEFDIVGNDEDVAELLEEGMEAFKKEHNIDKITAMGYYNDSWSGYMSDQTFYRIEERIEKPTVEEIKSSILRYMYEKDVYLQADVERIFEEGEEFFTKETTT